jgi:hypothetical protein
MIILPSQSAFTADPNPSSASVAFALGARGETEATYPSGAERVPPVV